MTYSISDDIFIPSSIGSDVRGIDLYIVKYVERSSVYPSDWPIVNLSNL